MWSRLKKRLVIRGTIQCIWIVVIFHLIANTSWAQSQNYGDFAESNKALIIDENFDNGQMLNYFTPTSTKHHSVVNGSLSGKHVILNSTQPLQIPLNADFEFEMYARHEMTGGSFLKVTIGGVPGSINPGQLVGMQHVNHNLTLMGLKRGTDKYVAIGPAKSKLIAKEDAYNKYTLRRQNNVYSYFINELFVSSIVFEGTATDKITVYLYGTTFDIDYIHFSLLADGVQTQKSSSEFLYFD